MVTISGNAKAVLLLRYVNFMKHYLRNATNPNISMETGISVPELLKKEIKSKSVSLHFW
jgi:hypothetical protein